MAKGKEQNESGQENEMMNKKLKNKKQLETRKQRLVSVKKSKKKRLLNIKSIKEFIFLERNGRREKVHSLSWMLKKAMS